MMCSSVQSEGGYSGIGNNIFSVSTNDGGRTVGTAYYNPMILVRINSSMTSASLRIKSLSMLTTTSGDYIHWKLLLNPTFSNFTPTYSRVADGGTDISMAEYDLPGLDGTGTEYISDEGIVINEGFVSIKDDVTLISAPDDMISYPPASIDINSTQDVYCLALINLGTGSATMHAAMGWVEFI